MPQDKVYRAIGLMSGTSLDGIDAALIETDGQSYVKPVKFITQLYEDNLRHKLRGCFGQRERDPEIERELTLSHVKIVKDLGEKADIIGFHGQTVFHAPQEALTLQLGDGALLARETGMDVVNDFRTADVQAGGQGAPLAPLYHQARVFSDKLDLPVAIVNIGGVANVTYIGRKRILAFDTGPGNALIDDFALARTGLRYDVDGQLAAKGKISKRILRSFMRHPYFKSKPPKSLDRNEWGIEDVSRLSDTDGAATLVAFTGKSIIRARRHMPRKPKAWYVCGGGRHNKALMDYLGQKLNIAPVEALGWNGDATEAECFGYLAVRSLLRLPLSVAGTTGVPAPQTGGVLHKAS